jgi:tetratricopeptide (TPR) repeat protein
VVLLRRLYLEGGRYAEEGALPQSIAYRLVDEAIKEADLTLASRLLQQLPQPPGGTELFAWQMRRAKVFLLAGDYAESDTLLSTLMPSAGTLADVQRDQVVQLLFELQAVNEHERAFRLFSVMYENVAAIALRRELLFWMADSRKAQSQYAEAARLYLQSATLSDNNSMDPWAQTARYQAAKSLSEAGMMEDAVTIYRQLLKVTENPERRSVLRHELQQLRLHAERG